MKTRIVFFASCFVVVFIVFFVVSVYFGHNPLNRTARRNFQLASILPQGWAFFTIKADGPRTYIFQFTNNGYEEIDLRSFSSKYYFGISRYNRYISVQASTALEIAMKSVNSFTLEAVDNTDVVQKLSSKEIFFKQLCLSKSLTPSFMGRYLIVKQNMLPWPLLNRRPNYPSVFEVYAIDIVKNE